MSNDYKNTEDKTKSTMQGAVIPERANPEIEQAPISIEDPVELRMTPRVNDRVRRLMEEHDRDGGKNVTAYESSEEFFKSLGIR